MTDSEYGETFRGESDYHTRVEAGQSTSMAVVRAVAAASGRKPITALGTDDVDGHGTLDPLYDVIDPEALDSLFRMVDHADRPSGAIEFVYSGYDVTVRSTGDVTVAER